MTTSNGRGCTTKRDMPRPREGVRTPSSERWLRMSLACLTGACLTFSSGCSTVPADPPGLEGGPTARGQELEIPHLNDPPSLSPSVQVFVRDGGLT